MCQAVCAEALQTRIAPCCPKAALRVGLALGHSQCAQGNCPHHTLFSILSECTEQLPMKSRSCRNINFPGLNQVDFFKSYLFLVPYGVACPQGEKQIFFTDSPSQQSC